METSAHPDAPPEPSGRLRDLAHAERPQERLLAKGPRALSDSELLALLLRSGSARKDVLAVSRDIIAEAGSLAGLLDWSQEDFARREGIGPVKAVQLLAVCEISRRILSIDPLSRPLLDTPELIFKYFQPLLTGLPVEKFFTCCLNRKNRLIRACEVTSGTAQTTPAHPREVFRDAVRLGASAVVAVHNHPSGDPAPSQADLKVTRALREAGRTLDILLLDHVIIGHPAHDPTGRGWFSFASAGLLGT